MKSWGFTLLSVLITIGAARAQPFQLAPAVALEAEDFTIDRGWKVEAVSNSVSGGRLLCVDEKDDSALAHVEVDLPETGPYRLWIRYEYPAFGETLFRVRIEQDGKTVLDRLMGQKSSPSLRLGPGDSVLKTQHDSVRAAVGLFDEPVTVPALQKGRARLSLQAAAQPQSPGSAPRRLDLVYLTRDTGDLWLKHYRSRNDLAPLLDAFRDSRGPRWEVRITNRSAGPATFRITHAHNRYPWSSSEKFAFPALESGKSSDWLSLPAQDTVPFGMVSFLSSGGPMQVELRPLGGKIERTLRGDSPLRLYLPPYPSKGEKPITPTEAINAILAELRAAKAPGKKPILPLCYGGWMPLGLTDEYGKKYATLYATLGLRSWHPALSGDAWQANLEAVGVPPSKSWSVGGYRNLPTAENVDRALTGLRNGKMIGQLRFFDYGDNIPFSEWINLMTAGEVEREKANGNKVKDSAVLARHWVEWLRHNRQTAAFGDYWCESWGPFNFSGMHPDSSAAASRENPRLYVDSLQFYEEESIRFAAEGVKQAKFTLGEDVLCGGTYTCPPFYYPTSAMCIHSYRDNAADLGRPQGDPQQTGQLGPIVNGYLAEHFLSGMRDNPKAVLRPYCLASTDDNFLRAAFTHLAHGATMLDFFGIGMNESLSENHIDHRDKGRYRALRDVTHSVGFVEDLLPTSRPVRSQVALLVSRSTERWDLAAIATDKAGQDYSRSDFRKVRLNYHLDRLGLWTALTFLGSSPDLVTEEDVRDRKLSSYRVLVVVGDCLPTELLAGLDKFVAEGGLVLATATAGQFDAYRRETAAFEKFFGLKSRGLLHASETFLRPAQELLLLKPTGQVRGDGWKLPQLAVTERIVADAGVSVRAKFEDGKPAILERRIGKGRAVYIAAQPGIAYLWSALQSPRGTTAFNEGVRKFLETVLKDGGVEPTFVATGELIDTRLLRSNKTFILPMANYGELGQPVTLAVAIPGPVGKVASAHHGELKFMSVGGKVLLTLPKLGAGDVIRFDP
jgi:Beta-galactosidase trimerisation domain